MDKAGVLEAVKQARAQCDLLVVSIHWGIEYAPRRAPRTLRRPIKYSKPALL